MSKGPDCVDLSGLLMDAAWPYKHHVPNLFKHSAAFQLPAAVLSMQHDDTNMNPCKAVPASET